MSRRRQLEELLKSDPEDVFLHYALAMEHVSEGNVAEGLRRLGEVIELRPDYVAAYFQRGQLLVDEGDVDGAREMLRRGIEAARRCGDAHAEREMSEFLDTLGGMKDER